MDDAPRLDARGDQQVAEPQARLADDDDDDGQQGTTTQVDVAVVVIGDFGRSPRMQYHALSLADQGQRVSVVAVRGTPPIEPLRAHPNVSLHLMRELQFAAWPRLLRYALKAVCQTLLLLWSLLFAIRRPHVVLVQNPPSVPTLPCVWLACRLRGSKMIVDWHNYGYTILAMNVRHENLLVKIYEWVEFFFGARADAGFCVSEAMRADLASRGIRGAIVLYDKPPTMFQPIDWEQQDSLRRVHEVLVRLSRCVDGAAAAAALSPSPTETALTTCDAQGHVVRKPSRSRPVVLLSSTSWTEDEDFGLLFAALKKYDKAAQPDAADILCIVTGKGPQKEFYVDKISRLDLKKVKIFTPWLDIADYPTVVALSNFGVCLHKSSSSLDLPMKIVDMFGCCVPVLAWNYRCISELVQPDVTGLLFESSDQLCRHLLKMCDVSSEPVLAGWRNNLHKWQELRWERNWETVAKRVLVSAK